ncbi:MAG TPA: TetR/AcrR family transcriptional regulator [Gammaproteobacteria bacterium]|nr:TetR/AcrR family transcriptional regulator [Gammaproteobacteria bacterium]
MDASLAEPSASFRNVDADREDTLRLLAVRRRIVAVAKHKFARFGYEAVSLQDIAHSADVPWLDFRIHFEDKAALLTAILDQGWRELIPRLTDAASNSISARNGILSVLAVMTNVMQKDEDLVRIMLWEGRRPDPESGELALTSGYRRFMQICTDLVVRGQRDGSVRPNLHPRVIASMIAGTLDGMLRDRLLGEQNDTVTPYTGTYLMSAYDALVSGLKA